MTFVIDKGEFVFVVGPSGSGKSTIVRLLLKELEPTSGRILVGGRDLNRLKRSKVPLLRRNVGCVFQDFKLLRDRSAFENVAYALRVQGESSTSIRKKVPEVLALVGLAHKSGSRPDELSGGEQQRVSIARAVVNHPPLLICDEPTGNLDPDTSVGIMQLLHRINTAGTTILMVTHDREMVDKMRKRVIALGDGTDRPRRAPRRVRDRVTRAKLVLSEALRSIGANLSTSFAATMTVLIGMFLLGLLIALGTWVVSWSDHVKEQLEVKVFFVDGVKDKQVNAVGAFLSTDERIKDYQFVTRAEALERMRKKYPELTADLPTNPLPASYEITPRKAEEVKELSAAIRAEKFAGVERVKDGQQTSKRILQVARVIEVVFLVAVIVLLIASVLLIANTIRLSIFSRRREIEVMKLVGATNWFVRGPFMVEGLLCGLAGALAAVVLLLLSARRSRCLRSSTTSTRRRRPTCARSASRSPR